MEGGMSSLGRLTIYRSPVGRARLVATPLLWRLSTSIAVGGTEAACEIVRLCRLRCRIEQMFRALKSDGMRLEETQTRDGCSSWP
jgi:hypothetical protein